MNAEQRIPAIQIENAGDPDFRARARAFREGFDTAFADLCGGADVYYAGKSMLTLSTARWVAEEGLRVDTASGGELAMFTRRLDLDDLLKEAGESPRPEFQEPGEVHDP